MIEAVNSSLVNAQVLRGNAEQLSASRVAVTATPADDGAVTEAPKAPFISPHISINLDYDKAVIQIRDSDTGDVKQEFPSESRLAQQSRAQAAIERQEQIRSATLKPEVSEATTVRSPEVSRVAASRDVITVQDVTSSPSANAAVQSPQIAVAALSAGAQSGQPSSGGEVSVLA